MKTYLVITITCPDRPGIIERITELALSHSANWEDSRMARLGGDFAGIVLLNAAQQDAEQLTHTLLALSDSETTVTVKATHEDPSTPPMEHRLLDLSLTGADHEGIVHKVSAYLAGQNINVESMETSVASAPMSGSPLFQMTAVLKVPTSLAIEPFASALQRIGDELGVDIDLQPRRD